jgi:hypothetical protein
LWAAAAAGIVAKGGEPRSCIPRPRPRRPLRAPPRLLREAGVKRSLAGLPHESACDGVRRHLVERGGEAENVVLSARVERLRERRARITAPRERNLRGARGRRRRTRGRGRPRRQDPAAMRRHSRASCTPAEFDTLLSSRVTRAPRPRP